MRELVRMKFGSQLYGTATPASDTDIKAVHVPSANEILLGRSSKTLQDKTKEDLKKQNTSEDIDFESFSLHHFIKLLWEAQAAPLEMLYAPDSMIFNSSDEWEFLRSHKKGLTSRKIDSWLGYARQQVIKFGAKGERIEAVSQILEPLHSLMKTIFGPHQKVGSFHDMWLIMSKKNPLIEIVPISIANGQVIQHLSVCGRKVPYGSTIKDATTVYETLYANYGKRTRAAQTQHGVDWKGLSHAVRISREAIDILMGYGLEFPLRYADHLLKIKRGEIPYEEVAEEIENLLELVEVNYRNSTLQDEPNKNWLDMFMLHVYGNEVHRYYEENAAKLARTFPGLHYPLSPDSQKQQSSEVLEF